jgi:hypothetical protein
MPRLRVLAGPTPTSLVPISNIVNTDTPHTISTDQFEGQVVVNIKGFTDPQEQVVVDSEYFHRSDRKDITWSIQVQGVYFPFRQAPWCCSFMISNGPVTVTNFRLIYSVSSSFVTI